MPAAWVVATLLALGTLQFGVAYWWWQGPYLEGTRGWVAFLFLLNGAATVLNLGGDTLGVELLGRLGTMADRPTNLALLALGLIALDAKGRWRRYWEKGLLALLPAIVAGLLFIWTSPTKPYWIRFLLTDLLFVAVAVGGVALLVRALRWDGGENTLWCLVLGAVGVRYAELSVIFVDNAARGPWVGADPTDVLSQVIILAAFASMVVAYVTMLALYLRDPPDRNRRTYEFLLAVLLAGFLFGAARHFAPSANSLAVTFTLAFVRPLVFLETQSRLDGEHLWSSRFREPLATGASGYVACLLGLGLGIAVGFDPVGVFLTGAGMLPLGVLAGSGLLEAGARARPGRREAAEGGSDLPDWPVDEDDVTLPPDWEDRLASGYQSFEDLDPEVREALGGLSYWERVLLALDGAPDGGDLPAYERTTPGLHLRTHCPYPSLGPEIRRANDRAATIADNRGIDPGSLGEPDLVESSWGRAQGLDSPRVKHYDLTPLGEEVAAAIREDVGLGDRDPEEVARVVAEGFARADGRR